jgi:flagellar biosynthesis/type III secretory pathway protein FliH
MKSLSKVLKFVDIRQEQPLKLSDFQKRMHNDDNSDDKFYRIIEAPRQRFQEDEVSIMMTDALKRANSIIESAKKEAENIIQETLKAKVEIEQEAFEKGLKDGYNKGYEKVQKKTSK